MSCIEIYSGDVMEWKGLQFLCETTVYFYSTREKKYQFSIPPQIVGTIICCDMYPNLVGTTRNFYVHRCKKIT